MHWRRALFEQLRLNHEIEQMLVRDAARRQRCREKQPPAREAEGEARGDGKYAVASSGTCRRLGFRSDQLKGGDATAPVDEATLR
jgi:hypothetical protein